MLWDCNAGSKTSTFTTFIDLPCRLGKLGIILNLPVLTIGCISLWHHLHQAALVPAGNMIKILEYHGISSTQVVSTPSTPGHIFDRLWCRASQALCKALTPCWKPGRHRMSISGSTHPGCKENPRGKCETATPKKRQAPNIG